MAAAGIGGGGTVGTTMKGERVPNGLIDGRLSSTTSSAKERFRDVIQDTLKDVIAARRKPRGFQQWVSHACSVLSMKKPRLQAATGSLVNEIGAWIQQGGVWRLGLVVFIGVLSGIVVSAFGAFILVVLAATVNVAMLAFILSISALSAFLAFFLASLSAIYLVSLAVSAAFISFLTFLAMFVTVCVAVGVAFFYILWRGLTVAAQCTHAVALASTGHHAILLPPSAMSGTTASVRDSKGGITTIDGFEYCNGTEGLDGAILTKMEDKTKPEVPVDAAVKQEK